MNEYIDVWKKALDFSGRARRKEYWMFFLINFVITLVVGFIPVVNMIYSLCVIIPSLSVTIRRLHDTNRSGWWLLAPLAAAPLFFMDNNTLLISGAIIMVGISIVLFVFMCIDGTLDENKFGVNPKISSTSTIE